MGRKPWTTKRQREWLESCREEYRQAQDARRLPDFYRDISTKFFDRFELRIGKPGHGGLENRLGSYDGEGDGDNWSDDGLGDACYAENEKQAYNVCHFLSIHFHKLTTLAAYCPLVSEPWSRGGGPQVHVVAVYQPKQASTTNEGGMEVVSKPELSSATQSSG